MTTTQTPTATRRLAPRATVPAVPARYFDLGDDDPAPVVVATFRYGFGWETDDSGSEVSVGWAAALEREAVTLVTLRSGNRTADFATCELVR